MDQQELSIREILLIAKKKIVITTLFSFLSVLAVFFYYKSLENNTSFEILVSPGQYYDPATGTLGHFDTPEALAALMNNRMIIQNVAQNLGINFKRIFSSLEVESYDKSENVRISFDGKDDKLDEQVISEIIKLIDHYYEGRKEKLTIELDKALAYYNGLLDKLEKLKKEIGPNAKNLTSNELSGLIKLNQKIGEFEEKIESIRLIKQRNISLVVAHKLTKIPTLPKIPFLIAAIAVYIVSFLLINLFVLIFETQIKEAKA